VGEKTPRPLLTSACLVQHLLDQIPRKNAANTPSEIESVNLEEPPTDPSSDIVAIPRILKQPPPT